MTMPNTAVRSSATRFTDADAALLRLGVLLRDVAAALVATTVPDGPA